MKLFTKNKFKNRFIYLFSIILFIVLWEILSRIINSEIILPSPVQVLRESIIYIQTARFWVSFAGSFIRVLLAFLCSFILGIILGFSSGISEEIRTFLSFPFSLLKSIPIVALIMVMLFWFDSKSLPVISAVIMTLPIFTDAVSLAVKSTDNKLLNMGRVFNLGKWKTIKFIYIPEVKPVIAETSRTVFSFCWKVVAAGEILSMPRNALGTLIQENRITLEAASVFSIVILLSVVSILSDKGFCFLFKKISIFTKTLNDSRTKKIFHCNYEITNEEIFENTFPLQIENLTFSYAEKEIIKDFNLQLNKGSVTCLFAPTGTGKTTLLNIISGIIPASSYSGKISSDSVSYIFQEPRLINGLTVLQNVLMASSKNTKAETAKAFQLLKECALEDKVFNSPETLSGGEKQKVQICRAFMKDSQLILMDEGTSSLDENAKNEIWVLMEKFMQEKNRTLLFVTHDSQEAKSRSDQIIGF